MALRIHRVDIGVGGFVLRQYLHEATASQITINVPFGAHQNAVAVERPPHGDLPIVCGWIALDLHRLHRRLTPAACRWAPHAVRFVALPDADAVVPGQVARRLRRAVFS